ncbi:unnamed protein product [Calypogeia fissa]
MAALLRGVARRSFAVVGAAAAPRGKSAAAAVESIGASASPSSAVPLSAAAGGAVGRGGSGGRGGVGGGGGGRGGGELGFVIASQAETSRRATTGMAASLPGLLGSGALAAARPAAAPLMGVSAGQAHHQQHPLSSSAAFLAHHRLTMRPQMTQIAHGSNQMFPFQIISQDGQVVSVEESTGAPPSTPFREQLHKRWSRSRAPEGVSSFPRNGYMGTPRKLSSSALLDGFDDNEGSEMDVEAYKKMHEISTTGTNVPDPVMTFASTGFPPNLMRELENAGFSSPSAIQAMTWPIARQSRDVVAVAKTGSGKTLGYLMPAFLRMEKRERVLPRRPPSVLVLAPTRELANQIREEAWKFGRSSKISVTCVSGGTPKGPQLRDIERGVDVLVATPGRLNDLLEMKAVDLRKVSYLVLDEADRMLDMGFEPQIRAIVDEMSPQRQTLMYTATWPHEVRRIARDLLTDPVQVNIGNSDQLSANKNITQRVEIVSRYEKQEKLDRILSSLEPSAKVLIFCTTKRMCDELSFNLRNKYTALALHGDKSQRERDYVMQQFKRGSSSILVATDVAARGLDIKDIRMVINYDFPTCVEDYVHRIGRTGRAGATGIAHTFFGFEDSKYAGELVKVLESTGQDVIPELRQMSQTGDRRGGRGGGSRWGSGGRGGGGAFSGRSSGSKWGNNDRVGGDKYGSNDRYGNGRSGSDRFGGDRFGGDRSRGDRFGGDRSGSDRFGGDRAGGRYGQGGTSSGNKWGSGERNDRPDQKWAEQKLQGLDSLQGMGSLEKSLFTPPYLKKNSPDSALFGGFRYDS